MELLNFFNNNNLSSFNDIKSTFSQAPFFLKIKDTQDLYILSYDKSKSDMTNNIVRECRGIILEKNTNKIICYSFNKNFDFDFDDIDLDDTDIIFPFLDHYSIKLQESIDGTQIRVFWYDNQWNYATTRCIDASKARWFSNKNFKELFIEASQSLNYNNLDKNKSYSFVLKHPENRIVVPHNLPDITHVGTRNLTTLLESDDNINVNKPISLPFKSLHDVIKKAYFDLPSTTEGFMLCDKYFNRLKIIGKSYREIKKIRGNTFDIFYRYLELRKDNNVQEYLKIFPENEEQFKKFNTKLQKLSSKIHMEYINKHVMKTSNTITWQFRPIVYKLHGEYLKNHYSTTLNMVKRLLYNLEPQQICFIYNKTYKKYTSRNRNIVEDGEAEDGETDNINDENDEISIEISIEIENNLNINDNTNIDNNDNDYHNISLQ
jgi:hypothetical protein